MNYFAIEVELSFAASVNTAGSLAWGKHDGVRRWTAGYGGTLIRGLVVGDLLWVVVIAFLFALITGVLG
jgi:hypothetical protein